MRQQAVDNETGAITAMIVADDSPGSGTGRADLASLTFCGLTLGERATRAVTRAGITRLLWVSPHPPTASIEAAVRQDGAIIEWVGPRERPFEHVPEGHTAFVVSVGTILEHEAIARLLRSSDETGSTAWCGVSRSPSSTIADELDGPCVLSPAAVREVRRAVDTRAALRRLAHTGAVGRVELAPSFCERLDHATDRARLERAYVRRLNGDEFAMTKVLRRQSVHLTRGFLRTGLSPNHITLIGLALSVAAAWALAARGYWPPLAGAVLYYLSTLVDCCDGEVARCSYRTSKFGCWLETWSDYASTLLIMAAVFAQPLIDPQHPVDGIAARLAIGATVAIIAILAAQRFWVARSDPDAYETIFKGEFNGRDASAMRRFMVWGLQYLKRAVVAHVVLFLALAGQLRVIVYLWAFGSVVALPFVMAVQFMMWSRRWSGIDANRRGLPIGPVGQP